LINWTSSWATLNGGGYLLLYPGKVERRI